MQTLTYIIKTEDAEYYCGKTCNIDRRLKEHRSEKKPRWFGFKNRHRFNTYDVIIFKGDFEKKIKRAGVKFIYELASAL